jgi:hypothetical protein
MKGSLSWRYRRRCEVGDWESEVNSAGGVKVKGSEVI